MAWKPTGMFIRKPSAGSVQAIEIFELPGDEAARVEMFDGLATVVGRLFADVGNTADAALYVTVGAAAMLGSAYAAPLTAAVFVAEFTGQASYIVPGLLAVTAGHLVVGDRSVSGSQVS